MPFDVCGAMSQGYIGYHLQQALKFALKKRGKDIPVATVLTQMREVFINNCSNAFKIAVFLANYRDSAAAAGDDNLTGIRQSADTVDLYDADGSRCRYNTAITTFDR